MKPKQILFKPEMVRAILDGSKSVTRRVVKGSENFTRFTGLEDDPDVMAVTKNGLEYPKRLHGLYATFEQDGLPEFPLVKAPFRPDDTLYVRETWSDYNDGYIYKTHCVATKMLMEVRNAKISWCPSIHMPKEAARLFLRVTGVRVEQLQKIDYEGCKAEGIWDDYKVSSEEYHEALMKLAYPETFANLWNGTIKKANLPRYGWDANPWVWVIEFEQISKEEATK